LKARLVLVVVLAALVSACGQSSGHVIGVGANGAPTTGPGGPGYMVQTAEVKGLGTVLVDGYGLTLYLFVPDHGSGHSTCASYCATQWPPATLPAGVTVPVIGGRVDRALIGTTSRGGTLQVTYNGWPLYRWIGDTAAGEATGQGITNSGGLWYAIDAAGQPVH
jgi:predicted lipoprotein with Yx(FWY)xxD motif